MKFAACLQIVLFFCVSTSYAAVNSTIDLNSDSEIQDAQEMALSLDESALDAEEAAMDQDLEESSAQEVSAADLKPVETAELQIIGRGVRKRSTGERIVAACVNATCDQFQFVYHHPQKGAFWLGGTHYVTESSSSAEKNRKKSLKKIVSEFRSWRETEAKGAHAKTTAIFVLGAAGAIKGGYILVGLGLSGATAALTVVPVALLINYCLRGLSFGTGATRAALRDQNGWNWSEKAKRVRAKTFDELYQYLGSK